MKNITYITLLFFVFISSCKKDVSSLEVIVEEEDPIVLIESDIRGKVVDEEGAAVPHAMISVGNEMVQSDANGCFHFKKVEVKKSGTIVKAESSGYFKGSSHSNFTAEGSSYVEIRMISKGFPQTFLSTDGTTFTTADGLKVTVPPSALVTSSGAAYNGTVNIYTSWIDPTDPDMGGLMPGALNSTDDQGNPIVLASYGMVAFELESASGQTLEMADTKEVEVEMPIPDELLSTAPATIPLWYFDLEEEQWLKSGSCSKDGSYYICKLPKSGFWNCDIELAGICLTGRVFNSDSTYSAYLKVIVEDLADNFVYWGYTDSTGYFCGSVPQAADLRIYIVDLCDSIVYTDDIGPYSDDFQLEDIYLETVVSTFVINITGSVLQCGTSDASSGHLAVRYPGKIRIYPFEGGQFTVPLALKCVEFPILSMRVYNSALPEVTVEATHNDFSDVGLGQQETCENLPDYFNLNVDGTEYWTSPTRWFFKNNTTTNWVTIEGLSGGGKFELDLRAYSGIGTYTSNVFFNTENNLMLTQYPVLSSSSPDVTVEITSDDGEYIEGLISGTATDLSGATKNISGDFRIRKEP